MTGADRIIEWCVAAGHHVAQRPGDPALTLTLASGGAEGRIEPSTGDDPVRFVVPVPLGDESLERSALVATLDAVATSRGPLVEILPGSDHERTAEVGVAVYPDGITRHAVLAALDELGKTRRSVVEAVRAALLTRALSDAFSTPVTDGSASDATPAPASHAGATVVTDATVVAPSVPSEETTVVAPPTPDTATAPIPETDATVVAPPVPAAETTVETPVAASTAAPTPRWCYVNAVTEVRDSSAPERVAGHLQPGTWYQAFEESGGWLRVRSTDGALDGWIDATRAGFDDGRQ